ncbi:MULTISPECIES: hypothetical protein [unclassified Sphingomonas]|uniref:hypothetical protein n=1 Tax=unclassified Sphingomonas TaxID=196159 RepID=UPI00226AB504
MTSLSSLTSALSSAQTSGRTMMNARISAAVSKGAISKTDQTALGSALDSIDSTLASSSGTSISGTSTISMKDKMASLIDDQVTKGTLTSDQADELKQFFATGGSQKSADGSADTDSDTDSGATAIASAGGMHGLQGAGGPPPGPPPSGGSSDDDDDSSSSSSSSSTSSTSSTSATEKSQLDTLIAFLEKMRSSIGSQATYGTSTSNGSTSSSDSTGLVFSGVA